MRHTSRRLAGALLLLSFGCTEPNAFQPPPPPKVTIATPVSASVTEALDATGVTESFERVEVRARVEGVLENSDFVEGSMVEKDQLLFVIDPRPFKADLDAAQASLKVANAQKTSAIANHKQARAVAQNNLAQYERARRAAESGAVTDAELDELRTSYNTSLAEIDVAKASISAADAQIAAAESAITQAQLSYDYTQVHSPIAGRVGRKMVDVGNLVGAGESTVLTTVIRHDPIYATFTISEAQLMRFIRRAEADGESTTPETSENNDREIRLGLIDEEGCPHIGTFDYADLGVDQATGTYMVRAKFDNSDHVIPPGAFVRIQAPREPRPGLLIPDTAIGRDQNGAYVAVVDAKNTVERKYIQTGGLQDGMRVVLSGLEQQDRVVVNGLQKARPGSQVTPTDTADGEAETKQE